MQILHVTTFLQGGAGRIITDLAVEQRRSGHDVRVAADAGGESGYASYPEYCDTLVDAGIPLALVASTFKRNAQWNQAAARELSRLASAWQPDIVHVHAATPSIIVRLAGVHRRAAGARLVHTMHGWGTSKTADQADADLDALDQADIVTVPSHAAALGLYDLGLRRRDVLVIPYGLPLVAPQTPPDQADVDDIRSRGTGPIAMCVGTLGERKNQRLLVDALAEPTLGDTIAVFIGDGDPAPLVDRAAQLGLSERVVVLGHRPDAARYLTLATVLVLPSHNEGLPIAVLEALRAGVPVAASRVPEIAEALGPQAERLLFAADDPAGAARAIRHAVEMAGMADVARLHDRFRTHYTQDRMVAAYAAVYERCGVAACQ
jgi:L-malate glycosyltransferase